MTNTVPAPVDWPTGEAWPAAPRTLTAPPPTVVAKHADGVCSRTPVAEQGIGVDLALTAVADPVPAGAIEERAVERAPHTGPGLAHVVLRAGLPVGARAVLVGWPHAAGAHGRIARGRVARRVHVVGQLAGHHRRRVDHALEWRDRLVAELGAVAQVPIVGAVGGLLAVTADVGARARAIDALVVDRALKAVLAARPGAGREDATIHGPRIAAVAGTGVQVVARLRHPGAVAEAAGVRLRAWVAVLAGATSRRGSCSPSLAHTR